MTVFDPAVPDDAVPRPPPRRGSPRRAVPVALLVPMLVAAVWGAGFAWFLAMAARPTVPPPRADAIVALTGGAERVEAALRLLAENRARLLLISGVPPRIDMAEVARHLPSDVAGDVAPLAERITLGRHANSTHGNAAETAAWAARNNVRSLIVVTAAYHMPRALSELGRAMPDVALYPVAVVPPARQGTNDSGTLGMLAGEYTKWLASEAGLGFLSRHTPEAGPAA